MVERLPDKATWDDLMHEIYVRKTMELADRPEKESIIPGGGGIRKLRWSGSGRGKRGGTRVIYYWASEHDMILLLYMYSKKGQKDLTPDQLKVLRRVVEEEFK